MAIATEQASQQVITKDGVTTTTVIDRLSPDRLFLSMVRASMNARFAGVEDQTPLVPREIRDLVLYPRGTD